MTANTPVTLLACEHNVNENTPRDGLQFLRDASEKDKPWDEHKTFTAQLSKAFEAARLHGPTARLRDCAEALFFGLVKGEQGEVSFKLRSAPFCHYRHCPVCAWRRGLKRKAIAMAAFPEILDAYPTARFAFLTLTVKNCNVTDLRATLADMTKAWKRLLLRQEWPALGWIRATEVTLGKDGNAHPHFHVLLMLPASYFSTGYITQRRWTELWQEAGRLDYKPRVDIRVIKAKSGSVDRKDAIASAISEVLKYPTKVTDLISAGPDWLREFVKQVRSLKFTASGGVLKGILKATDDDEDEDLVHVSEDEEAGQEPDDLLAFHYRKAHSKYARKRT